MTCLLGSFFVDNSIKNNEILEIKASLFYSYFDKYEFMLLGE